MRESLYRSLKGQLVLYLILAITLIGTGFALAAPPPPPLSQVVAPDVNKLGLLDCIVPGLAANCGAQYAGFPITKPGQKETLIAFGKALFWDMQVGSDGVQACASCHFHAGADNRIINQKNPGLNRVAGTQIQIKNALNPSQLTPNPDTTFTGGGTNYHLQISDFPLPFAIAAAAGPNFGNNDRVSSQGVNAGTFSGLSGGRVENGNLLTIDSTGFNLSTAGLTSRRVTGRNSPSAIGAIFNLRNFFDGRANLFFNGVNPFGMLDPAARVTVAAQGGTYTQSPLQLMIPFSSLASQAVGPPGSDVEMSLNGRNLQDIGRKLLAPGVQPLDRQSVASTDSVLGSYVDADGRGLNKPYAEFIKDAFQEKFWKIDDAGTSLTLMKNNFALFFGLAVQAYEATLIPDQTPLDALLATLNQTTQPNAASANPIERGLAVFLSGRASCSACHIGAETTSASVGHLIGFGNPAAPIVAGAPVPLVALAERMVMGDGSKSAYDTGFYNIGVRPTADDLSIFNRIGQVPFSFGMLAQEILRGDPAVAPVNSLLLSGNLNLPTAPGNLAPLPFAITVGCAPGGRGGALGVVNGNGCRPLNTNEEIAIRGSFKTPGLRNLKFTGPYMHNGSLKNIHEVVNFYDIGGRFNMAFNPDNCRTNNNNCRIGQVDFDAEIAARGFSPQEISDLVALMEVGMTDTRVAKEQAPFDHPQLCLPHGHLGTGSPVLKNLPAVGATGHSGDILTFEQMLSGVSGEHDLSQDCDMTPLPNVN